MAGEGFKNIVLSGPVSPPLMRELAAGHHGTIKIVVDVKTGAAAAGGQWHTDCLGLLKTQGSNPADCWGAKLNIETGAVAYKSQINQNRPGNRLDEIANEAVRAAVKNAIEKHFRNALEQMA